MQNECPGRTWQQQAGQRFTFAGIHPLKRAMVGTVLDTELFKRGVALLRTEASARQTRLQCAQVERRHLARRLVGRLPLAMLAGVAVDTKVDTVTLLLQSDV